MVTSAASLLEPPSNIVKDEFKPTLPRQTTSLVALPAVSVSLQFPEKLAAHETIGNNAEDAIIVFSSAALNKALF